MDMLPCASGEGSCLFSLGDHLGIGAGGVVTLPQRVPWQAEQMEVMEVIAPIDMVGGSQILPEELQRMMRGSLTGGKEVMMTFTFLP